MRFPTASLAVLMLSAAGTAAVAATAAAPSATMIGFTSTGARAEATVEAHFDQALQADELKSWLEQMSSAPNHVGSPHDKANAEFMLSQFRAWGWDAHIETFRVLYPTPRHVALSLDGPKPFRASLIEPPIPGDRSSANTRGALPPYNAFGADGDVRGELVYVNHGMPEDYKDLERRHIAVKGRIVIARYGGGWRGLKPKLAYEHGAIGCIIYSDPRDDGYGAADTYPAGAGRPAASVQRGSVADMPIYSGDPLTPNIGATADAPRLAIKDATTILKIPVLPISYQDARPFLEALAGPRAPAHWRGGLPISYHIGPGPAKVHLSIQSDWSLHDIYDVIATLKGSEYPDEWVIRGNHHDGWVFGASDPLSGNVALMAEMKSIGALAASGWKPKRTLIYASWDAEEPGLLGSTEWVETHAKDLAQHAVAYVNSDGNSNGILGVGGSPILQHLVNEVAAGVTDPVQATSVLARQRAAAILKTQGHDRAVAKALLDGNDVALEPLGSGSDFTPFLQHAGIPALNIGFGDGEPSGVYHSVYDSFDHYIKVEDPTLRYGVALAEVAGHTVLRLADAELLPFRAQDVAVTMTHYVDELTALADKLREDAKANHQLLDQHVYELAASNTDPVGAPERAPDVPFLSFAPLQNAVATLTVSAKALDGVYATAIANPATLTAARAATVNAALQGAEQTLLGSPGLPGRPWYRHLIYAPGLYTGYGAKTMPGVREAIEEHRWQEAGDFILQTAAALEAYSKTLDAATAALK